MHHSDVEAQTALTGVATESHDILLMALRILITSMVAIRDEDCS
jgi:hypothetical protein